MSRDAMPQWHFTERRPGDTTRDPVSGEFFATEAIAGPAEALIRESIQNSLDAGTRGERVTVRITLSLDQWAAPAADVRKYLPGLSEHLKAPKNGLIPDQLPDESAPVPFVAIEDFGTKGIGGDPVQWHRVDGEDNSFFAFFRAEGENAKSEDGKRGRWGIGKYVFPRSSSASAFLGWTIRADDRRSLLLGRCILKSHSVNGVQYCPDGYFGVSHPLDEGDIVAPIEEHAFIDRVRQTFRLWRNDEPGLSVVVLWPDPGIDRTSILEAVIRDWFYSLVAGELNVELRWPAGTLLVSKETIDSVLHTIPAGTRDHIAPLIRMTKHALGSPDTFVHCESIEQVGAMRFDDALLSLEAVERIKTALDSGEPVTVQIPLTVRRKRGKGEQRLATWFLVTLLSDKDYKKGRPVFVREGIVVSDAKGKTFPEVRSLVVATDQPIADLLGDAENPAHTEWRQDTANFKERYILGKSYLDFVRESVRNIMRCVRYQEEDIAPDLLNDVFSLPEQPDTKSLPRPTPKQTRAGDAPPPPVVVPIGRSNRYSLNKVKGGFRISAGAAEAKVPAEIRIVVAYDVRAGNPLKKYRTDDFRLFFDEIDIEKSKNVVLESADSNTASWRVLDRDFELAVVGFDTNRDLVVNVTPVGELHA